VERTAVHVRVRGGTRSHPHCDVSFDVRGCGVIHHGDCVEVMATLEPDSIDAIVTDPPYGLLEGFPWLGIEREAEYVAIAEARLNGTQRGLGLSA
jgi:DNA modification methylase